MWATALARTGHALAEKQNKLLCPSTAVQAAVHAFRRCAREQTSKQLLSKSVCSPC